MGPVLGHIRTCVLWARRVSTEAQNSRFTLPPSFSNHVRPFSASKSLAYLLEHFLKRTISEFSSFRMQEDAFNDPSIAFDGVVHRESQSTYKQR